MSYSQNDEERVILEVLEMAGVKKGTFLDIGAWDGRTFSNTLRLVELGWTGVCVEPSPTAFVGLMRTHQANQGVTLLNAAVGRTSDWLDFFDSGGDAVSSSSPEHVQKWSAGGGVKFTQFMLKTVGIEELFTKFGPHFDFINLDVESLNWDLFQAMPWLLVRDTAVICVEHDCHDKEMLALASEHGFVKVAQNAENLILKRA